MTTHWIEDGCTLGETFFRGKETPHSLARKKFIRKYCGWNGGGTWPFVHQVVNLEQPWFKDRGLDPLVIPLCIKINEIPGVKTVSSCQGYDCWSPVIHFRARNLRAVRAVAELTTWGSDRNFNTVIVGISNLRRRIWAVWLYDTLALMEFNRDVLGVPLLDQLAFHPNTGFADPPPIRVPVAPIEEIEAIIGV